MKAKEAITKAIELIEKEKNEKYNSIKGKNKIEKQIINAVVSNLVNVEIMLRELKEKITEENK